MASSIDNILGSTLDGIRKMVDVETVIGDAIKINDETTLLPISKVSVGFAAGGTTFGKAGEKENFGGGAGGGVKVTPVAFLVINGTEVRTIFLSENPDAIDKIASYLPAAVDKIASLFEKDEQKTE